MINGYVIPSCDFDLRSKFLGFLSNNQCWVRNVEDLNVMQLGAQFHGYLLLLIFDYIIKQLRLHNQVNHLGIKHINSEM